MTSFETKIFYNSPAIFLIHSSYRSYRSARPFIKIRENLRFNFEKNYCPWTVALFKSVEKKIQTVCGNGFTVNSVWKNSHVSKQITGVYMNSWIDRDKAGNTKIHGIDRDHVLLPPRNCAFLVSSARKIVRRASRNEQSARNPFIYPVFQSEKPSCSFPCMRTVNRFRRQKSVHFFDCYTKFSSYLRGGGRAWFEHTIVLSNYFLSIKK